MRLVTLFLLECHNRNASYNDASGSILALSSFFQVSAAFTLLSLCLSLSVSLSLSPSLCLCYLRRGRQAHASRDTLPARVSQPQCFIQ